MARKVFRSSVSLSTLWGGWSVREELSMSQPRILLWVVKVVSPFSTLELETMGRQGDLCVYVIVISQ